MNKNVEAKWEKLAQEEKLVTQVINMEPNAAQKKLQENGYDFSVDDLLEMKELLQKVAKEAETNDELSEETLTDVSGGKCDGSLNGWHAAGFVVGVVGTAVLVSLAW